MVARTISQLPEATGINNNDLLETSQLINNNSYTSRKIKAVTVRNDFCGKISGDIANAFHLYSSGTTPINVYNLSSTVNQIINGDGFEFNKTKQFNDIIRIEANDIDYVKSNNDKDVPNIEKTKSLIDSRACFIGDNYYVYGNPGSDTDPAFASDSSLFMHWHFDDNTRDSTLWINPKNKQQDEINGIQCQQTGYLTMYGWLADNGQVLPQDCWVGLYGRMQVIDESEETIDEGKWILLQMQPWIKGTYSSNLQYVCFNLPVQRGLWLKVKTGFLVNGHVGGFQDSRSITYALNKPNSFVGYISAAEDK